MSFLFKLSSVFLAALLAINGWANPGDADPRWGYPFVPNPGSLGNLVLVVPGAFGVPVSNGIGIYAFNSIGQFDNRFVASTLPYDSGRMVTGGGNLYFAGSQNNAVVVSVVDGTTGRVLSSYTLPIPQTYASYIASMYYSAYYNYWSTSGGRSRVGSKAATSRPLVAIGVVLANATYTDFRTGVYLYDPATNQLAADFGTGGYAFVQGNFQGRWLAATADSIVIGGVSKLDPAHPGIGVANFDTTGNPGTCGGTVKEVLPRTNQFVLPDTTGGFYAPGSGLVTFVGEANGSQFFGRQLKPDCTLNATTFTYPKAVFAGEAAAVSADTMAVVVNEVGNGTSAARVALYPLATGGAPSAVSPIITSVGGTATGSGEAKALSAVNTNALGIAVQPDAKILIGGTTDARGGGAFVARYVGIETTTDVVEFYNTTLKHYFITADPNEATAIDGGSAGPGWSRTGQTWKSGGPDRVCRFYGVQAAGGPNGHFYTIDSDECAAVKLDPGWHFESYDFSGWPVSSPGVCPAGTIPVKRVYNGRFAQHDSNHRYATTDAIYNQMIAQGWSGEGTVFCAVQ